MTDISKKVVIKRDSKLHFLDSSNVAYGTESGYNAITETTYPPTGGNKEFVSKQYSITSNNLQDSCVKMRCVLKFAVYKAGADVGNEIQNRIGLRAFPMNRAVQNSKVELQNMNCSTNIHDYVEMLCVSMDDGQASMIAPAFYPDSKSLFKSSTNDNALRWSDDTSKPYNTSRGWGQNYSVKVFDVNAGVRSAPYNFAHYDVVVSWDEILMARPFQYQENNPHPFVGLGNYKVNLDFVSNPLSQIVNLNAAGYVAGFPPVANYNPIDLQLVVKSYQPHLSVNVPSTLYYNSPIFNRYEQSFSQVANNSISDFLTINNVQMTGCPSMFALCVRDASVDTDMSKPYNTFNIEQVSIKLGDRSGLLSEYSSRDLYNLSRDNGYKLGYNSFSGEQANPLQINPQKEDQDGDGTGTNCWLFFKLSDLGTNEFIVSNSNQIIDITVQAKVKNVLGAAKTPTATLYVIRDNVVEASAGNWSEKLPLLSAEDINNGSVMFEDLERADNVLGGKGKFLRGLKRFGQRVLRGLTSNTAKNISKTIRNLPVVKDMIPSTVHSIANATGYGVVRSAGRPLRSAGRKRRTGGQALRSGGKKMTKAEMMKKLGM